MGFHHQLSAATRPLQDALFELPFAREALAGRLAREEYAAFLAEAWHVGRHVPGLLSTAAARLPDRHAWLRPDFARAADGQFGRDELILSDLEHAGGDPRVVRLSDPGPQAEVLVAYAWDLVLRREPVGLLGLQHVLAFSGVRGASRAADNLRLALDLPAEAFRFLQSHGTAGLPRVDRLAALLDRIDDAGDRRFIGHVVEVSYRLAAEVLQGLSVGGASLAAEEAVA